MNRCLHVPVMTLFLGCAFSGVALSDEPLPSHRSFLGDWALVMPNASAGWLMIEEIDGKLAGELWTVGGGKRLAEVRVQNERLHFVRRIKVGKPKFEGGPPTAERLPCQHTATISGKRIELLLKRSGEKEPIRFSGTKMPPLPSRPDLTRLKFGKPIRLFNGKDLSGWELTNPQQINGWKAERGELVNTTPKLDFAPYSKYGNLRTKATFSDFHLTIEFKVPKAGNSGIYLRGMYEAQVVDRDSRMQGIQGVGAIFGRIQPSANAGKKGGEWNRYEITLINRHVTVVLNGKKVIDNRPIRGCTNGALYADVTRPGPIYLQGDHTAVSYRNIVLTPIRLK